MTSPFNHIPSFAPIDGSAPEQLVIFMHGVGADGSDLISLAPHFARALPNAQFLSPDAPAPCDMAPFGRQWFSLQNRDPQVMYDAVEQVRPVVNAFFDEQLEKYGLSDDKLLLIGFSQGTMTALHCALRRPKACAGIVGFSGALLSAGLNPTDITAKPPVLLVHGEADEVVPFQAMAQAENILEELGVDIETMARPDLPHSIDEEGLIRAIDFAIEKL